LVHLPKKGLSNNIMKQQEPPPSPSQLKIVAMRAAIPMIGFGFIDNVTMITAGEAIDASLGVAFGLSTMAAAGFGQCVSDVAGLTGGGLVDAGVSKMKLPHHGLTQTQMNGQRARVWGTLGGCVGVLTGCLLGMSCLLFMDTDRAERAKKAKELDSIFVSVMSEGHHLVDAERATLWMLDGDELWSRVATGTEHIIKVPKTFGLVGACVQTGKSIIIPDAYEDARFNREIDKHTGYRTRSMLVCPVKSKDGAVVGAIQMINKKDKETDISFVEGDLRMVRMLASHVSGFMRIVNA
jgi:hypothetical protein